MAPRGFQLSWLDWVKSPALEFCCSGSLLAIGNFRDDHLQKLPVYTNNMKNG